MAEASRISEARRDAVFGRWVVFSPARSRRPTDLKSHNPTNPSPAPGAGAGAEAPKPSCPFCAGRESECAPQIFRVPPDGSLPWRIRVIENLYPALRRDVEPPPAPEGADGGEEEPGELSVRGFGFHDVVIETPRHDVRLWDLDAEGVREVLLAYAERVRQLEEHPAVKYVQVEPWSSFCVAHFCLNCTIRCLGRFIIWIMLVNISSKAANNWIDRSTT